MPVPQLRRCLSFTLLLPLMQSLACTDPAPSDATPAPQAPSTAPVKAPATPPDAVVMRIGKREITAAEFARLVGRPPQRRSRETEGERRLHFLAELERTELFAIEAQRLGVLDQPSIKQRTNAMMIERMLEDRFGANGSDTKPVTEAETRAYYESHLDDYSSPERVRARHIVVRDRAQAAALLAKLLAAPQDAALFTQLATTASLDGMTRARGGDLGYFERKAPPPAAIDATTSASMRSMVVPDSVRAAAFALTKVGDVSAAPVKSEAGYHIVQLLGRKPAARFELGQVARVITEKLTSERREAALAALSDRLKAEANVKLDASKLALVRPKLD